MDKEISAKIELQIMYENKYDEYMDTKDLEEKKDLYDEAEALKLGMDSVDIHSIAKKPVMLADEYGDRAECCPNCREHIVNVWNRAKYEPNYCHYCGQRLKWDKEG